MTEEENREKFPTGKGLKVLANLPESQEDVLVGRRLGDYDVTAFIAEGGMSRVYAATRSDGSCERVRQVAGVEPGRGQQGIRESGTGSRYAVIELRDSHSLSSVLWPCSPFAGR